jgi:porphobilinogen synthase
MRRMVAEHRLHPAELILPVFVRDGIDEPVPVSSMPGVVQHTRETLKKAAAEAVRAGVGGIMIFGVPKEEDKDAVGSAGTDPDGILQRALRDVRAEVGDDIVIMSDLCLDETADHGHCGVLDAQGRVDNDATLERYAEMACVQAEAGAHVLGPSGMMDGQIGYVRRALDAAGHQDVSLFAYTAKYASAFYGPFRGCRIWTCCATSRSRRRCPSASTRSAASTRWSRPRRRTAGSTGTGRSWRP